MRVNRPQRRVPVGDREYLPEHNIAKTARAPSFRRRIMFGEIDPIRAAAVEEIQAKWRARETYGNGPEPN